MPIPNLEDFSKKVVRSLDQAKQYAAEKIGAAEMATNFPPSYLLLDEKVDKLKLIFDGLTRVTNQLLHSEDYSPPIGESFLDAIDKLNVRFERLKNNRESSIPDPSPRIPPTIPHATADICIEGADILSSSSLFSNDDTPAADLLQRYGQIQMKLGEIRIEFNNSIIRKFVEPFETYIGAYENVNKARRIAQSLRLELDSCKGRLLQIKGPKPEELRLKVESLERDFHSVCEDAIAEMKSFIQYTEATHCIEALIQAQLTYHRKASEILSALD